MPTKNSLAETLVWEPKKPRNRRLQARERSLDRESAYPVRSAIEGANFLHGSEVRRSIPQEVATTYEIGRGGTEGSTETGEAITKSRTNRWGTDVSQRPQGRQRRARQGRRMWGRLRTPEVVGDDQQRRKWKEAVASLPFPSKFIRGFLFWFDFCSVLKFFVVAVPTLNEGRLRTQGDLENKLCFKAHGGKSIKVWCLSCFF